MNRFCVAFAFAAVLGAASTAAAQIPAGIQGEVLQQILVKVNGDIFTKTELETRQIAELRFRKLQVTKPEDLQTNPALVKALIEITPGILVASVDELLKVQRARELGYKFTEDRFKEIIDNIKKENKLDDAAFKTALAQEGITLEELREQFERQWLVQAVEQDVMKNMSLTDEEARQYYKAHPNEFMKPPTAVVREILVVVPTTMQSGQQVFNAAAADAANEKAKALRERIVKGEKFAAVATEASEAPSKANGGLIGPVNLEEMTPELREVIQKLKPGDVSEPLRVARGYTMFAVDSISAAEVEAFDKVRTKISQKVMETRRDVEMTKYVQQLRTSALIEWKHDEMKKLYDKGLAAAKAGDPAVKMPDAPRRRP